MSTFLELVNRARRECGVSGGRLATLQGELSVESQRFADWINDAWREVQMHRPDWLWTRRSARFETVAGQGDYDLATIGAPDVAQWRPSTFTSYPRAAGRGAQMPLRFVEHDSFLASFQRGHLSTQGGVPMWVAARPDMSLRLWPVPQAVYVIEADYQRTPTALSADTDTPQQGGLPERFDMLIVYKAMLHYAGFEAAPEVMGRATAGEKREMGRLEDWGLPDMTLGDGMA